MKEEKQIFSGLTKITAKAIYLSESINLRAIEISSIIEEQPFLMKAGNGYAAIFRYGVTVLFNMNALEEASVIESLKKFASGIFMDPEIDEFEISISPENKEMIKNQVIYICEWTLQRLQTIALALSKSVVLARYEMGISKVFETIEPLSKQLEEGKSIKKTKSLLKYIGSTLRIQHQMVGKVEVEENPELIWEFPEMERLYKSLEYEYELQDRHQALESKLNLISRTAETVLDILNHQSSLRVEWYIVILILVEILLSLYTYFLK